MFQVRLPAASHPTPVAPPRESARRHSPASLGVVEPRKSMGRGLVAFDRAGLARRARLWREIADEAEARLAIWRERGDCSLTVGATGRTAEWAHRAALMARAYEREATARAPPIAAAVLGCDVLPEGACGLRNNDLAA